MAKEVIIAQYIEITLAKTSYATLQFYYAGNKVFVTNR